MDDVSSEEVGSCEKSNKKLQGDRNTEKNEYGIKRECYDLEQKKKISKKKSCRKIN